MTGSLRPIAVIARKEMRTYFSSPLALIFIGVFLAVTLFLFFWVDTFFGRNIADVRPLFSRLPTVLIFLVATLTMRQWSEEQRTGTLEVLLTLPVARLHLVLGKLAAVVGLVTLTLALTVTLPITAGILGDLDWGPVIGGYLAAILMVSAYAAIGLFVSSRTQSQIVALIVTVLICGALYAVGTSDITKFAGEGLATVFHAVGIGSRFASIERGVIDLRDLVYYVSLTTVFVVLNVVSVDMKRWGRGARTAFYRRNTIVAVALLAANLAMLNAWLFPFSNIRLDLTDEGQFSLSEATVNVVNDLDEPLVIRAYISERTHPLLAPLAPNVEDLMGEYEVASRGMIKAEVIDPRNDEAVEREANQIYGIRPVPFRITDRYETSVVNSYFDILVRYGDQFVTLSFNDLIEVEPRPDRAPDVRLRNLEFDLTKSIKRVVSGFQSLDLVLGSLAEPIRLTAYVTPETMPESLREVVQRMETVGADVQGSSGGGLVFQVLDPDDPTSGVTRRSLQEVYGLTPYPVSFFSRDSYYLHMVLDTGQENMLIYPSEEMTEADIRSSIDSAIRQLVPGFLKTVGLWVPHQNQNQPAAGDQPRSISSWNLVYEHLAQNYDVSVVDLSEGRVPSNVDVLVVIAPQDMTDKERFAIDQFLMRGGSTVIAAGRYMLSPLLIAGILAVDETESGLDDMLASYGVSVGDKLVMDPQNEPLPAQVERNVGGFRVREIQRVDYPLFVDVRRDGMAKESPITADLPAVTLHWTTALEVDQAGNESREVVALLRSTDQSWLSRSANVEPDKENFPEFGFPVEEERQPAVLAVSIRGSLDSFFKGKPSPLAAEGEGQATEGQAFIETSPDSTRLLVVGSGAFLDDVALSFSRSLSADRYLFNLQFLQNTVDWLAEDEELLSLRSQGTYTRLLKPLDEREQTLWEALNYAVALIAVVALGGTWAVKQRSERPMELSEEEEEL